MKKKIEIPKGTFCGGNCYDCAYWNPNKKDSYGKTYCEWYSQYYFPSERQGCLSFK